MARVSMVLTQAGEIGIVLSSLFNRFGRRVRFQPPSPDDPICVIGDVHGCIGLLEKLLTQVPQDHRIILVGDYIDRGEHSAEVLSLISTRHELTCLKGNHEELMLRFFKDPIGQGARWLRNGGLQTLASFDIRGVRPEMNEDELTECRDRLQDTMGAHLCQWMEGLKTWDMSGNVLTVHAGADPEVPPKEQSENSLIWGHPSFQVTDRRDGVWVVHGHTIVNMATARRGRIPIDTGAFATGVLSAVCMDGTEPRFLSAQG